VRADGSGQSLLPIEDDGYARWSPDGSTLAFKTREALYLAQPDGSAAHKVADLTAFSPGFLWSYDGQWLAVLQFREQLGPTEADLYILRAGESGLTYAATVGMRGNLHWSQVDNQLVYYVLPGDGSEKVEAAINLLDPATLAITLVAQTTMSEGLGALAGSPDGRYLLFNGEANNSCVTSTGLYLVELAQPETKHFIRCTTIAGGGPHWSADGQWIAFTGQKDPQGASTQNALFILSMEDALRNPDAARHVVDAGADDSRAEVAFIWQYTAWP
jgi:Tol biopolymer transport system component